MTINTLSVMFKKNIGGEMKPVKILFCVLLFTLTAFAQDLKIGFTFGNVNIQGLYTYTGNNFFVNTDWNSARSFGISAKYNLENLPLRFSADFIYSDVDGAGFYNPIIANPNPGTEYVVPPVNTEADMLSFNLGGEWVIVKDRFSPYVGATINYLSFSDIEVRFLSFGDVYPKPDFAGESLLGGGIRAGSEIQLVDYIMIDLNAHYIDYDLFINSKESTNSFNSLNLMATLYLTL